MGAIYLVRHGQASFGAADYDVLSDRGEQQARAVGAELRRRGLDIAEAHCGTLSRQRATAAAALAEVAPAVVAQQDPRWNEYDHVDLAAHHGAGVGQDSANPRAYQGVLDGALAAWVDAGDASPCAETWPMFSARVRAVFDDLASTIGKGKQAVVFTSGGVIATVCGVLLGDPVAGLCTLNRVVVNGSITKIVTGRSGTTLVSFNEHGHFDGRAADLLTYR